MKSWRQEQLVGFTIKDMKDLKRIIGLRIANMVELRAGGFARSGTPLYEYVNRCFVPNRPVLEELRTMLGGISVQVHVPFEKRKPTLSSESGLNIGVKKHLEVCIKRFLMFERIFRDYGIGRVLTFHPPMTSIDGKGFIDEDEAIGNARRFFEILDKIRIKEKHETSIGVENMPDGKVVSGNVGYMPKHFKDMLRNTRTIGLTVDTGHRRLAKEFTIRGLLQLGIPPVNFHFHGNKGEFNPDNFDDDEHALPNEKNIKGYANYLRYFRRHRTPIVLEISNLESYTDEQLVSFVANLKNELE